jgi:hypothetical protein
MVTDPRHFEVYWHAYLNGQRKVEEGFEERRRDARIKQALEAISDAPEAEKPNVRVLQGALVGAELQLTLDQPDHAKLCAYIESCAGWNPLLIDTVVDALDALQAADKGI